MKKTDKLPSFVILLILTAITALFWVSFNIYRVFSAKPPTTVPAEIIKPVNPNIDIDTLELIQKRIYP